MSELIKLLVSGYLSVADNSETGIVLLVYSFKPSSGAYNINNLYFLRYCIYTRQMLKGKA